MASLPGEVLLGLYLGLLTGILPAFAAGSLGFLVRYLTGVSLPGFGVVVLALSIASVNGGLLGLVDPAILATPRLFVAALVVLMLSLYAHHQGDRLGATLPRRFSLRELRQRTLSADVVELVGGMGQVTVRPTGTIEDLEGYPPLPAELRAAIAEGSWQLPADLPLSELERRLEDRLKTEHDLANVVATIDSRGRATIAAAPPTSGLSRRVPDGKRAVSIDALVPTGLARGERLTVETAVGTVDGTLVSARSDPEAPSPVTGPVSTDGGTEGTTADEDEVDRAPSPAPTTTGGEGRVTVAVSRRDAATLLRADRGRVIVHPRGTTREFEVLSLLHRAGWRVRRLTVGSEAEGRSIADLALDESAVRVLALRRSIPSSDPERQSFDWRRIGGRRVGSAINGTREHRGDVRPRSWQIAPDEKTALAAGDELYVVGRPSTLRRFAEVIS